MPPSSGAGRTTRRAEVRRNIPKPTVDWFAILSRPDVTRATAILAVFIVLTSALVVWSREQVKVADGQIMTVTALKRLDYAVPDRAAFGTLEKYAQLEHAGKKVPAGYVEASRGCKHICRHCPVTPVYEGR